MGVIQKSRTVRCKYCDEVVDDIVTHKAEMHPNIKEKTKVRICPICNYRGHQLTTFVYHMMVEHNDTSHGTVDIHKCNSCDFQSCFQGAIQRHTRDVHGECIVRNLQPVVFVLCTIFKVFSYCGINLNETGKVKVKQENQEELDVADASQSRKASQTRCAATITRSAKIHYIATTDYILSPYQCKVYSYWA